MRHGYALWLSPDAVVTVFSMLYRDHGVAVLPLLSQATDECGRPVAIPEDVKVASATYDWERQMFGLLLEHPSFPPVDPGSRYPNLRLHHMAFEICTVKADGLVGPFVIEVPKP